VFLVNNLPRDLKEPRFKTCFSCLCGVDVLNRTPISFIEQFGKGFYAQPNMLTRRSSIVLTCCLLLFLGMANRSQIDRLRAGILDGERVSVLETVAASAASSASHKSEVERHLPLISTHVEPLLLLLFGSTLLAIATGIKSLLSRKPLNVDR
jgi:hypothetical protein